MQSSTTPDPQTLQRVLEQIISSYISLLKLDLEKTFPSTVCMRVIKKPSELPYFRVKFVRQCVFAYGSYALDDNDFPYAILNTTKICVSAHSDLNPLVLAVSMDFVLCPFWRTPIITIL